MRLRDFLFTLFILLLTFLFYIIFEEIAFAVFCFFFFGIVYTENETIMLVWQTKTGKFKLREDKKPQFKEYYEVTKWWMPIILFLTSAITSIAFSLREMPESQTFVLFASFMWTFAYILVSFTFFVRVIGDKTSTIKRIWFNSIMLSGFTIATAMISGFIATFFRISQFEDVVFCIIPVFLYSLFRLYLTYGTIFMMKISSIEQAIKMLSLSEERATGKTQSTKKIVGIRRKLTGYLEKSITLSRQETEILSDFNSKNLKEKTEKLNAESTKKFEDIKAYAQKRQGEIDCIYPVFSKERFALCGVKSNGLANSFAIFDCVTMKPVYNEDIAKELAFCMAVLRVLEKTSLQLRARTKAGWHAYLSRLRFLGFGILNRTIAKQILSNVSRWLSTSDHFEQTKYEGLIGLDVTALLDHILIRSSFYNSQLLRRYEKAFLKLHVYHLALSIKELRQRQIAINEERIEIWKTREEAAGIIPSGVLGSEYILKSSKKIREQISKELFQLNEWLESVELENSTILDAFKKTAE
jgi:hypothetical protein